MKRIITVLGAIMLVSFSAWSQEVGIKFQSGLSWKEIKAKAKSENKYIFVDCFATWCGPCKWMDANIFNNKEVGLFFNEHFVSVKVQLNKTDHDSKQTVQFYDDAEKIKKEYGIMVLPTYLFFAPEGEVIHRMAAIEKEPKEFIKKSAEALDVKKQYYVLIKHYKEHITDSAKLINLIRSALELGDNKTAAEIGNHYFKTLTNPYLKDNLRLISRMTTSSQDVGFKFFLNNYEKVNQVMGKRFAESFIFNIIFSEEITPLLQQDDSSVNWKLTFLKIKRKFPKQAEKIVSSGKIQYYLQRKDWQRFEENTILYMKQYMDAISGDDVNMKSWNIFQFSKRKDVLCLAADWMKTCLNNEIKYGPFGDNYPLFVDTYANLLYKSGNISDAIIWEKKALAYAIKKGDDREKDLLEKTLTKMQNGAQTWPEIE